MFIRATFEHKTTKRLKKVKVSEKGLSDVLDTFKLCTRFDKIIKIFKESGKFNLVMLETDDMDLYEIFNNRLTGTGCIVKFAEVKE